MVQNRYLAYGYRIENGVIRISQDEAEVVRRIYQTYADGLSYKAIAERLTAEGIRYIPEKPAWNKNMVARILQNGIYPGTEKYPKIVDGSLCQAAKQAQKPYTHTESVDIKRLKPLLVCAECGAAVKRRLKVSGVERWYCEGSGKHISTDLTDATLLDSIAALQGRLIQSPQLAKSQDIGQNPVSMEAIRLHNEIDRLMDQTATDEKSIRAKIMELAATRYADCRCGGDKALEHTIGRMTARLDAVRMLKTAEGIRITSTGADALVLKNGNAVGKE